MIKNFPAASHGAQGDPATGSVFPSEIAVAGNLSDHQALEKQRRLRVVRSFEGLKARGYSLNRAARELGESPASLSRYYRAYLARGEDGLAPATAACGARPKFRLTDIEADALRGLVLEKESLPLAVEDFVKHPECSEETRALILAELGIENDPLSPEQRKINEALGISDDVFRKHNPKR
jgi:hypothetical protein